ncbi:MAG: class I SAM-dependent methyltransferase [Gammaproteobacteria bacterium]|nr:class I SAM-dependent methyltransferase [Gammaproteobacteria bacterium]
MGRSADVFDAYGRYYDLLYRDKDYAAEVDYIDSLLREHRVPGRNLLEFGSGTGKHGRLLAQRGYDVTGVERSAEMVARAEQTNGFRCQEGDICTVQLGLEFDAVLSLFHVVSYQVSNSAVSAVFARAAEHLKPGGLFIFDIWYSPAVYAQGVEVREKKMSDEVTNITRLAEPVVFANENRVDVNYTIHSTDLRSDDTETILETHSMRHFSLPELDLLAEINNCQRLRAEEFLTGRDAGENTWGVCVVLQKS